ncbi:hypothetical protein HELRODRAFT_86819, partial [Helobdella robusta]|uniref:Uncharacterized protein n=1 Tax=Helobdella robusta TaxID=6412 RepID=T1G6H3_HELRO
ALAINISAVKGLQEVLKSNLGPKGKMKIKEILTRDGNVLLIYFAVHKMVSSLIAKVTTAQDGITGDGTISNCPIIGKQVSLVIEENVK